MIYACCEQHLNIILFEHYIQYFLQLYLRLILLDWTNVKNFNLVSWIDWKIDV